MGYELLLVAGPAGDEHEAARRATLSHAAAVVPGMVSVKTVRTRTCLAAVVETSPAGGSVATIDEDGAGTRLTVAITARGLTAAASGAAAGAERAHASAWFGHDDGVELSVDGVSLIPVHWARHHDHLLASTHLASLVSLGLPPHPDELGVAEYLAFHHPLGEHTLLRGAAVLPPGSVLTWRGGRAELALRPPAFVLAGPPISDSDFIAAFAERWEEAIGDAFTGAGRVGVGISGGMDSRAIAAGAVAAGHRPLTFTYGDPGTAEGMVAGRVAETLGLAHLRLPVTDDRLLAGGRHTLELLDGVHSPNEMYDMWFAQPLRRTVDTVVNGHAGDPLWGDAKITGLTDAGAALDNLWRRYGADSRHAAAFLAGDLRQDSGPLAHESLATSLREWDFEGRSDIGVMWNVTNRQFRWGHAVVTALRRSGIRPEVPFLDRRVLALLSRLSPEQHRNGALYLELHRVLFPRTAGVPRSDDGNPPAALNHLYWSADRSYVRQLAELTLRHPLSGVRRATRQGRHEVATRLRRRTGISGPADRDDARRSVFPTDVWLRTREVYAERLCGLLQSAEHPLISSDAVEAAVDSIRAGRPVAPATVLGRVAALVGWLADYDQRAAAYRRATA